MPAKSRAQQRLMAAAEHGASFPMARKIQSSMTHQQMHDFAVGSMKNKPGHVAAMQSHPNASRLGAYLHPKKGK
jgi:carbamoylphosphate synthase small subunit